MEYFSLALPGLYALEQLHFINFRDVPGAGGCDMGTVINLGLDGFERPKSRLSSAGLGTTGIQAIEQSSTGGNSMSYVYFLSPSLKSSSV